MSKVEKVTTVEVGEKFQAQVRDGQAEYIVKEPCANKNNGFWCCVTHDKSFPHQWDKDSHIHTGKHRLAWICYEHGAEKPWEVDNGQGKDQKRVGL